MWHTRSRSARVFIRLRVDHIRLPKNVDPVWPSFLPHAFDDSGVVPINVNHILAVFNAERNNGTNVALFADAITVDQAFYNISNC